MQRLTSPFLSPTPLNLQVRQMSENEGLDAMMSRLSFSASLRAEQLAMQEANKLPITEVMKISFIFCLLVSTVRFNS